MSHFSLDFEVFILLLSISIVYYFLIPLHYMYLIYLIISY